MRIQHIIQRLPTNFLSHWRERTMGGKTAGKEDGLKRLET